MDSTPKAAILLALKHIPKGKVTTYGGLAELAGLGKAARYAGTTLRQLPKGTDLPWHRVVNAQGKISFPESHPGHQEQKRRLEDEGVTFIKGKIDLKVHRFSP